jgi:hypothetical protein
MNRTSRDSRFYPRISAASSTTITCPQAVLDQFKPIKTPAVDEETPAVYYVEADGLTIHEAALAAGIPVAYFDESQGGKPRASGDHRRRNDRPLRHASDAADSYGTFLCLGSRSRCQPEPHTPVCQLQL